MKINHISNYVLATLLFCGGLFCACNDAGYDSIDNGLFFSEALSGKTSSKLAIGKETVKFKMTPHLGRKMSQDVQVDFVIDTQLLEKYNALNHTSYEILPAKYLKYKSSTLISAGDVAPTETPEFEVMPYADPNGEMYAIPLSMKTANGVSINFATSQYIVLLDKALIQAVPEMDSEHIPSSPGFKDEDTGAFTNPWNYQSAEWSLEMWVMMDSFDINNQAIANISASAKGKSHEIYIRFGDAGKDFNMLQVKTAGSQVDTKARFEVNKWYHLAFTYGISGKLTVYVNGQSDVTLQTVSPGIITYNGIELCSSSTYFVARCQMAQVRFWKKEISQTQILANMNYQVKASDPNLFGYWKLDDASGATFKDYSVNKKDMVLHRTPTWIPNVHF